MKRKIFILTILILVLMSYQTPKSYAWGPVTHVYYTERALQLAGDNYYTRLITNNKQWFLCGMMYPDVTVIYYYTKWTSYSATHAWEFQRKLWQTANQSRSKKAMAFALGVGAHLLQDSIVHNYWIPQRIKNTFIQNNIIHPLSEGFLETRLIHSGSEGSLAKALATTAFSNWESKFNDGTSLSDYTPAELCGEILSKNRDMFKSEASTFNIILQGGEFYTKGYAIPEAGGLWSIYKGFSNLISNLPFVSGTHDADKYINMTIELTVKWFTEGQPDNPQAIVGQYDPTGYDKLKSADSYVVSWTIVITIVFILSVILYKRYKGK